MPAGVGITRFTRSPGEPSQRAPVTVVNPSEPKFPQPRDGIFTRFHTNGLANGERPGVSQSPEFSNAIG